MKVEDITVFIRGDIQRGPRDGLHRATPPHEPLFLRRVLDCASPLALLELELHPPFESARGLAQSKTLTRY